MLVIIFIRDYYRLNRQKSEKGNLTHRFSS
jgi:hypothetical protein